MKGRVLASPRGLAIRPSSDVVREAIFNIIGQDLSGLNVLDLFAGTGSLGLEALSRGALRAFFIDNSQQSISLIKKNLGLFGYQHRGVILRKDLRKGFPRDHSILTEKFDVVFLDPPYRKGVVSFWLEQLSGGDLLSSGSMAIAESVKTEGIPLSFGKLKMVDTRYYGDTMVSIYRYGVK